MSNPDPLQDGYGPVCPDCGTVMDHLATQAARVIHRCRSCGTQCRTERLCDTSFDDALRAYVYDGEEV